MGRNSMVLALLVLVSGIAVSRMASGDTVDGSCMESWELYNFQPQSSTFDQLVESSSYFDHATIVLLLSSG